MLEVHQLSLSINRQPKIHPLSFTLAPGERACLLGASGSGKSLIARCLLDMPPPGSKLAGHIRSPGRPAAIFQDSSCALHPLISVGKQLTLAQRAANDAQPPAALLAEMGFEQPAAVMKRYPGELSGGQRQRICIALALLSRSPLLIADEPTTALDVVTQRQVLQALQRGLQRNPRQGLLFITHDIAVAAMLCRRALVMADGRLVEQGELPQLLAQPRHPATQALITAARQSVQPLALAS